MKTTDTSTDKDIHTILSEHKDEYDYPTGESPFLTQRKEESDNIDSERTDLRNIHETSP